MKKEEDCPTYVQNTFNPMIATRYGSIGLALVLEYFKHCVLDKNEKVLIDENNQVWIQKSLQEINDALPYLSVVQITKIIKKLIDIGYIEKKRFGSSNFSGSYVYAFTSDPVMIKFLTVREEK